MTTSDLPLDRPRRFHFDWVFPALFRPRATLARIAEYASDVWLTPILVLMLTALLRIGVAGPLEQLARQTGQNLPPAAQWWTPEQLQQYMEIQNATSGPVFIYVFPAIISVLGIWVGWLVLVGILHLVLTLTGGRGSTRVAMNTVAWASLPFAVRDLVQVGWMMTQQQLIAGAGLAGFAPNDGTAVSLALSAVLALVDIYIGWQIALLIFGVRAGNGLPLGKAISGVLITMFIWLALQALPGFLLAQFGGLQVVQPFFF
jgi:hypothetical protein